MRYLATLGIAAALTAFPLATVHAQEVAGAAAVTGAGSSFAYPIISRWAHGYRRWVAGGGDIPQAGSGLDDPPAAPILDYEPSGSLAGMMRVRSGAVDFGASDVPMKSEELQKLGLGQFPIVTGGIVVVVNISGVRPKQLKLSGPVLADIYLGKIQSWNDPKITALNPDLKLPDAKIVLVRRADGSGTTFHFTGYLSRASAEWKEKVGSDLAVKWPAGQAARGNEGVANLVKQTANAIGYVEFAQAMRSYLSYALIENRAGKYVEPSAHAFQQSAARADWKSAPDFYLEMSDVTADDAYPLVATVFVMMPRDGSPRRMRAAFDFFRWALEKGAKDADVLGYVPLPEALVQQVKEYWAKTLKSGA